MRACCLPLTQMDLSSLLLPSSTDSRGRSLSDGKRKLDSTSPLVALTILKMQEVGGRRGPRMKTSAAARAGNSLTSLSSSDPDREPKNEGNFGLKEFYSVNA